MQVLRKDNNLSFPVLFLYSLQFLLFPFPQAYHLLSQDCFHIDYSSSLPYFYIRNYRILFDQNSLTYLQYKRWFVLLLRKRQFCLKPLDCFSNIYFVSNTPLIPLHHYKRILNLLVRHSL